MLELNSLMEVVQEISFKNGTPQNSGFHNGMRGGFQGPPTAHFMGFQNNFVGTPGSSFSLAESVIDNA
ncbi:hypothetical protein Scep_021944 [Stephania cephalantha]|uniref:Uncharacterized protein n=1 Tax=Stephania cephalantha TaxID=152367 RepID=A0AAP0F4E2_9MAGN